MSGLEIIIAFIVNAMSRESSYFETASNGSLQYGKDEEYETVIDGLRMKSYFSGGFARLSVKDGEAWVEVVEYWASFKAGPEETRYLEYGFHGLCKNFLGRLYTSNGGRARLYEEGYSLIGCFLTLTPEGDRAILPREFNIRGLMVEKVVGKPSAEFLRARREDIQTLISIHG